MQASGIAKEGSKFVAAKTKALQKCEDAVVQGPARGSVSGRGRLQGLGSAIAKAVSKLAGRIAKSCGGDDKICGGTARRGPPVGLGWPSNCPDFESNGPLLDPINNCNDIVTCLKCIHKRPSTRRSRSTTARSRARGTNDTQQVPAGDRQGDREVPELALEGPPEVSGRALEGQFYGTILRVDAPARRPPAEQGGDEEGHVDLQGVRRRRQAV